MYKVSTPTMPQLQNSYGHCVGKSTPSNIFWTFANSFHMAFTTIHITLDNLYQ